MTEAKTLSENARVWVYQNVSAIEPQKVHAIEALMQDFVSNWQSHNRLLDAHAAVLHHRFLILAVDESTAEASGCSIDTSVHFIKELERRFGLELFNRLYFSYKTADGDIDTVDQPTFSRLYAAGEITDDTIVFDTMIKTYGQLQNDFEKKLGESWHRRMV